MGIIPKRVDDVLVMLVFFAFILVDKKKSWYDSTVDRNSDKWGQ